MRMDVRNTVDIDAVVQSIVDRLGAVDVLFDNAGLMTQSPFGNTTRATRDDLVGINITGIFNRVQAVVPVKRWPH